jgi:magnesium transporter
VAEDATEPRRPDDEEAPQAEDVLGLSPELVRHVADALDEGDPATVDAAISELHYAEFANLIEQLSEEQRAGLIERMRPRFDPDVLPELDDSVRDEVVRQLGTSTVARAIAEMDSDDALYVIDRLDEPLQRDILAAIPKALLDMLEEHLAFPEESAGRLMQRDFVAVPTFWTVGQTIDFMRETSTLPDEFYDIFVVDPRHRPVGIVALSRVLRNQRPVLMSALMEDKPITVPATMDQEEVAYIFRQQDLVSAPVVDASDRLIGVITIDDVVDVIDEEAGEDLLNLGGVREDDLYASVVDTIRTRFPWLSVNLCSAFLSAFVISLFETTIAQIVVLAALMPIVASMGGNAGVQSVTVSVRAIAMKELTFANARRNLSKAALVGTLNGLIFAVLIGGVAWGWSGRFDIGLVIGTAVVGTLIFATVLGTAIPVLLTRLGIDPAVASGPTLSTITDSIAFLTFLGLATLILI